MPSVLQSLNWRGLDVSGAAWIPIPIFVFGFYYMHP